MSSSNCEIYDSINKDIDGMYSALLRMQDEKPDQNPNNIQDLAQKVRDGFRLHLHNRRNADKNAILLDKATVDTLKDFNENCFKLLQTFKGILEKKDVQEDPDNKFASLEEFKTHVWKQKEILNSEFIKATTVKDNMDNLISILQDESLKQSTSISFL